MEPTGFNLIFEQGPCLVVVKPAGLLTQAPPSIDSLERRVKGFIKVRDQKPGRVYLGVPHRLDRPVSGLLVLARHVRAARRLSEQFSGRLVEKSYWALLEGNVSPDTGRWVDYVRKIPGRAASEIVDQDHPEGRMAALSYRVMARGETYCQVEIQLETGRTHQIRVQAAARRWPILGDEQYGSERSFGPIVIDPRLRCIALHARRLAFRHPMTREPLDFTAALPDYWNCLAWDE